MNFKLMQSNAMMNMNKGELKLVLDKNRFRVKFCPCGKDNKDGKFIPFIGFENYGYCHSCAIPIMPPLNTSYYFVVFQTKSDHSEKSFKIIQDGKTFFIPKSTVSDILGNGFYVAEWYLQKQHKDQTPKYSTNDLKTYGTDIIPPQTYQIRIEDKAVSFIPFQRFNDSMQAEKVDSNSQSLTKSNQYVRAREENFQNNHFLTFLNLVFGPEITKKLKDKYLLGYSDKIKGAVIFWQKDIDGNIRTGKIMQYNPNTGKRIHEESNVINWEHKSLNKPDFHLKQCFYGEHLLKDNKKTVAIVESEKSCIIASVYFPELVWLASGGKDGLNVNKCKVLKGRTVILFPDISKPTEKVKSFKLWTSKAKEFSHIANFIVSDLLEVNANDEERIQGLDIADYLLKQSLNDFRKTDCKPLIQTKSILIEPTSTDSQERHKTAENDRETPIKRPTIELEHIAQPTIQHEITKPHEAIITDVEQSKDIQDLEKYFNSIEIPIHPIQLNDYMKILNPSKFIQCNLSNLKTYEGNKYFLPHLERLKTIKHYLEHG